MTGNKTTSPALAASQASWRCVEARDKEGWLNLMSDDVLIEDPIGPAMTNPDGLGARGKEEVAEFFDRNIATNNLKVEVHETFPSSSDLEIAHVLTLHSEFVGGHRAHVRGVFAYRLNEQHKITNLRGWWNMDSVKLNAGTVQRELSAEVSGPCAG